MRRVASYLLTAALALAASILGGRQQLAGQPPARPAPVVVAAEVDNQDGEAAAKKLFRDRILPALKDHCYECHSAKSDELKGNLRVDTREGLRKGGDNGPAVTPSDVEKSFLLKAMSYREDDYKMPPRGKLEDELLEDFQRWVKLGAPDDR